jgi:hypothetical protein
VDDALFELPNLPAKVKSTKKTAAQKQAELEAFDAFWAAYPKRQGKQAARKAFAKQIAEEGSDPQHMVAAAVAYAENCVRIHKDPQFIPHPTTWLNQGRFDDDLEEAPVVRSKTDIIFEQNMADLARMCEEDGIDIRDIGKPKPPPVFNPDIW